MAVRTVVTRTGRSFRGKFSSRKMDRQVCFESLLELDAIYHFEFCSQVVSYREQPEKIEIWVEVDRHIYFPDFELVMNDGEIVHVEVKPKAKLRDPALRRRLAYIEDYYRRRGIRFIVLTEDHIRIKVLLNNLKQLAYYCRWQRDDWELQEAVGSLSLLPAATVEGAKAVLGNERDVYRLLAAGA
jgi:hypothetical protein